MRLNATTTVVCLVAASSLATADDFTWSGVENGMTASTEAPFVLTDTANPLLQATVSPRLPNGQLMKMGASPAFPLAENGYAIDTGLGMGWGITLSFNKRVFCVPGIPFYGEPLGDEVTVELTTFLGERVVHHRSENVPFDGEVGYVTADFALPEGVIDKISISATETWIDGAGWPQTIIVPVAVGDFFAVEIEDRCPAELDGDLTVTVGDLLTFLAMYFDGSSAADIDGVEGVQFTDLLYYLAEWFASNGTACPGV